MVGPVREADPRPQIPRRGFARRLQPGRAAPPRDGPAGADLGRPHRRARTRARRPHRSGLARRLQPRRTVDRDHGRDCSRPLATGRRPAVLLPPKRGHRAQGQAPHELVVQSGRAIRPRLGHGRAGAAVSLRDLRRSTGAPRAGESAPPGTAALGGNEGEGFEPSSDREARNGLPNRVLELERVLVEYVEETRAVAASTVGSCRWSTRASKPTSRGTTAGFAAASTSPSWRCSASRSWRSPGAHTRPRWPRRTPTTLQPL